MKRDACSTHCMNLAIITGCVCYEEWQDQNSLTQHLETDHYKIYRQKVEHLVDLRKVHKLTKIQP